MAAVHCRRYWEVWELTITSENMATGIQVTSIKITLFDSWLVCGARGSVQVEIPFSAL